MEQEHQPKDLLIVDNQQCPVCGKDAASFSEYETIVQHVGLKIQILSLLKNVIPQNIL
jgi:hypothetical protein